MPGAGGSPEISSGGAEASAGASGADATTNFDYPIDPDALAGCRSPVEPGCDECCIGTTDDGRCDYLRAQTDWSKLDVEPWYHIRGVKDGACPHTCEPCARCLLSTEKALRRIEFRPECDCSQPVQRGDVCYDRSSCPCYCSGVDRAVSACPPAEE